jgi:hypothetical protein
LAGVKRLHSVRLLEQQHSPHELRLSCNVSERPWTHRTGAIGYDPPRSSRIAARRRDLAPGSSKQDKRRHVDVVWWVI